jgi:adenylate kinase family enzyme
MERIIIVGNAGSGKSTLASQIHRVWGYRQVELDSLFWQDDWRQTPPIEFREEVQAHLESAGRWVATGNYSGVRDLVWSLADSLIWLDYPLWVWFPRLLRRTINRIISQEPLWGTNNRESWQNAIFDKNALWRYALRTHKRRRRQYVDILASDEYAHLTVFRHRHPHETRRWLQQNGLTHALT